MIKRILMALAIGAAFVPGEQASAQIVVIVNAANPEDALSKDDVRAYFMRLERAWRNGEKVRPIDHPSASADRSTFITAVLGMSEADLERHWIQAQYASAESPPTKAPDTGAVISLVRSFKGGIGFVSKDAWDAADQSGLRAVFTAGSQP